MQLLTNAFPSKRFIDAQQMISRAPERRSQVLLPISVALNQSNLPLLPTCKYVRRPLYGCVGGGVSGVTQTLPRVAGGSVEYVQEDGYADKTDRVWKIPPDTQVVHIKHTRVPITNPPRGRYTHQHST